MKVIEIVAYSVLGLGALCLLISASVIGQRWCPHKPYDEETKKSFKVSRGGHILAWASVVLITIGLILLRIALK